MSLVVSFAILDELDFRVTPTAGCTGHARVLLDRCYLEVTPPAACHSKAAVGWFLRPADLAMAADTLRNAGIDIGDPAEYAGHDGIWLDVEPDNPMSASGLPTLTRRVDLDQAAWPPPLAVPHPNGVTGLTELHIYSQAPDTLGLALELLGTGHPKTDTYTLGDGTAIVIGDARGSGGGISKLVFNRPASTPLQFELCP